MNVRKYLEKASGMEELLLKAGRQGLVKVPVTDKNGRRVTRWMRPEDAAVEKRAFEKAQAKKEVRLKHGPAISASMEAVAKFGKKNNLSFPPLHKKKLKEIGEYASHWAMKWTKNKSEGTQSDQENLTGRVIKFIKKTPKLIGDIRRAIASSKEESFPVTKSYEDDLLHTMASPIVKIALKNRKGEE